MITLFPKNKDFLSRIFFLVENGKILNVFPKRIIIFDMI